MIDDWVEREVLYDLGKGDDLAPGDLEEVGLYFPLDYAFETWLNWRNKGVYPEPGGYNDQDYWLMLDWKTFTRRYNHFARVHSPKTPDLPTPDKAYAFEELI